MLSALFPVRIAVFLAFLLVLLHSFVDTRLIYDHQTYESAIFAPTWRSFKEFVRAPGDVADWCSRYISQANRFAWGGPAANVAVIGAFLLLTAASMRAAARGSVRGTWVVPGLLLMALYGQYDFYPAPIIGLLAALVMMNAYVWMPIRNEAVRLAVYAAMAFGLYFVAAGACFLFAAGCVVFEMVTARRWAVGAACIPIAIVAAAIVELVLPVLRESQWHWPGWTEFWAAFTARWQVLGAPVGWEALRVRIWPFLKHSNMWINWGVGALYAYVPLCAAAIAFRFKLKKAAVFLWRKVRRAPADAKGTPLRLPTKAAPAPQQAPAGRAVLVGIVQMTVLLGVAVAAANLTVNRDLKREVTLDSWSTAGRWDDILLEARKVPKTSYTFGMNMDVNRALYEKGLLAYDMFSYPQEYQLLSGVMEVPDWHTVCRITDLLLAMGRVNEAEAFAGLGYQGPTMARLAKIKIIKKDYGSARIFLTVLSGHAEYGPWAQQCLRRIEKDPGSLADEEISRIRSLTSNDDRDYPGLVYHNNLAGTGVVYAASLQVNPHNKMAFEYLMAFYLLQGKVEDVCKNMVDRPGRPSRLSEEYWVNGQRFRYPDIPRHYEEAMLIYQNVSGHTLQVPGKSIRPETRRKFEAFSPLMMEYQKLREQKESAAKAADLKRESKRAATQAGNRQREAELDAAIAEDVRRGKELGAQMDELKSRMRKDFNDTYYYFYYMGEGGRP